MSLLGSICVLAWQPVRAGYVSQLTNREHFRLTLYPSPNAAPDSGSNRLLLQFDPRAAESLAVIFGPRMTGDLLSAIDPAVLRAARSRSGSYWLAGRQAQARQNEFAV